jgi:hypothetical protein
MFEYWYGVCGTREPVLQVPPLEAGESALVRSFAECSGTIGMGPKVVNQTRCVQRGGRGLADIVRSVLACYRPPQSEDLRVLSLVIAD